MSGLQNNLLKRDENKLKQISFPRQTFLDISTRVSNFGCICLTWDPAQVGLIQTLIPQKIKATFLSYRSRFTCRLKFHKRDRQNSKKIDLLFFKIYMNIDLRTGRLKGKNPSLTISSKTYFKLFCIGNESICFIFFRFIHQIKIYSKPEKVDSFATKIMTVINRCNIPKTKN